MASTPLFYVELGADGVVKMGVPPGTKRLVVQYGGNPPQVECCPLGDGKIPQVKPDEGKIKPSLDKYVIKEKILALLKPNEPMRPLDISKAVLGPSGTARQVNPALYELMHTGALRLINETANGRGIFWQKTK